MNSIFLSLRKTAAKHILITFSPKNANGEELFYNTIVLFDSNQTSFSNGLIRFATLLKTTKKLQGHSHLFKNEQYCPLGVLGSEMLPNFYNDYTATMFLSPEDFHISLGLRPGTLQKRFANIFQGMIILLNDNIKLTFLEFADSLQEIAEFIQSDSNSKEFEKNYLNKQISFYMKET